jgi:hypothetical protein
MSLRQTEFASRSLNAPLVNAMRVVDLIDKHRPGSISCCAAH